MPNLPPLTQAPTPPVNQVQADYDREVRRLQESLERVTWAVDPAPSDYWGVAPVPLDNAPAPPRASTVEALNRVIRATYGRGPADFRPKVYCTPPCRKNCKCGRVRAAKP